MEKKNGKWVVSMRKATGERGEGMALLFDQSREEVRGRCGRVLALGRGILARVSTRSTPMALKRGLCTPTLVVVA
jgi:hypothetical protein